MLLVADASVLVSALADFGPAGHEVRSRLVELGGDELHVIQTLTDVEVLSALRKLVQVGRLEESTAAGALKRFPQLPAQRHELTQPMRQRIWELRANITAYDAAYIALVERLQSESRSEVKLATADSILASTPGLMIEFEEFSGLELD